MSDHVCERCGAEFYRPPGPGRPPKYCPLHRKGRPVPIPADAAEEVPDVLDLREPLPPHRIAGPEAEPVFHAPGARRVFPKESVFELIHYADLRVAAEVAMSALRRGEPGVALRALEGAQPRARSLGYSSSRVNGVSR